MINADDEVSLAYLLDPCFQLVNTAGKPLTDGYIEVYLHGTRTKYYCYSDWAGTLHPFQIPLDSLGSNIVLASPEQAYDVYVYNRFGSLIMSRYNVIPVNGTSEGGGGTSNISITSSDGTITVTDTLDPETGIKTYDLSVPWASGDASYWHSRGASNQGQLISDTDTHVLAISEHPIDHEGEDITVGSDGKFHLKEGVYFWTVNVDLYSDSLSNNTQQIYINSNINRASYKMDMTRDNQHSVSFSGITVATQDDYQEGFTIKTEGQTIRAGIYEVAIHKLNPKVLGTKYDAGYGIVIEDDTISVDPEVIPSVSTVSGMIQEAITSIPEYTAGEYIKIEDNEISVTGLQPAGDYLTQEDLEGYATETYVDNSVSSFVTEETVTTLIQEAITAIAPEPELPLVAGDGITITEYEDRVEIAANVTSIDGYATLNDVAESAVTSIQLVTGMIPDVADFTTHTEVYEATVTAIEYVTGAMPETTNLVAGQNIGLFEDGNNLIIAASGTDITDCATHSEVYEATVTAIEYVTGAMPETTNLVAGDNIGIIESGNDLIISASATDLSDCATKEELQDAIELVTGLIPEAQVQSDWAQNDNTQVDYIKNKPVEYTVVAGQNIGITIDNNDLIISASGMDLTGYVTDEQLQDAVELVTGLIPIDYVSDEELQDAIELVTGQIPVIQLNSSNMVTAINNYPIYSSGSEGTTYTAGDGIDIVNNIISVDNTVALKTDIPVVTGFVTEEQVTALLPEEEEVEFLELTAGNNISIASGVVSVVDMPVVTGFATKDELQDNIELATGLIPTVQLNSDDQVTAINNHELAVGSGGSTYTGASGILVDDTNDIITLDEPIFIEAGSGISFTQDGDNIVISCTASGGIDPTVVTTTVSSVDFPNMGFKIDNGGQAYKYGGEYRSVTKQNEAGAWEPNLFVINNVDGIERIAYTSSNLPENTEVVCLTYDSVTLYTGSNGSIDFTVISEEDWPELYRIRCYGLSPVPSSVTFVYDTFAEEAYATETYVTGHIPDVSDFITYSASGVELTNSNFKIDPDGQAYKKESTTATITPTGTYSGGEITTFNMADLQRTAYTSNITNGYAKLNGTDINIRIENADGSFDLSIVSDSEWNNATELVIGSYWPAQEAVISYTGTTKAYVPYISAEVPSNTGTYVLKCINGVIQWVSES